jgi:cytochrome bd ubiquinol oxidase subunit II
MHLSDLWFIAIAALWTGYFVLEGFDFGVGILLPVLGRTDGERRVLINTIGPVWDGNEVWLLTAGGATFAAFPNWYATMFSAFYLPLLLVLVALIVRGVAFEFRGKHPEPRWRRSWDWAIFGGSLLPALVWGVAFGDVVRGIRLDAAHVYTGSFSDLLNPYALLGGLATLLLFTLHGAVFVALRTTGALRDRANAIARPTGIAAILAGGGFLAWTELSYRSGHSGTTMASAFVSVVAALALAGCVIANRASREGWAFAANALAIAGVVGALFTALYPDVLRSSLSAAWTLTVANSSSTAKTLAVMTVVAGIFLPLVLAYQAWTYWVFRKRLASPPAPAGSPAQASGEPAPAGPGTSS